MAYHIYLEKINESGDWFRYKFDNSISAFTDPGYGVFEFHQKTGQYRIIKICEGDTNDVVTSRAIMAIIRAWKKGPLPDVAEWAS